MFFKSGGRTLSCRPYYSIFMFVSLTNGPGVAYGALRSKNSRFVLTTFVNVTLPFASKFPL